MNEILRIGDTVISLHPGFFFIVWIPVVWIAWRATGGWRD